MHSGDPLNQIIEKVFVASPESSRLKRCAGVELGLPESSRLKRCTGVELGLPESSRLKRCAGVELGLPESSRLERCAEVPCKASDWGFRSNVHTFFFGIQAILGFYYLVIYTYIVLYLPFFNTERPILWTG